MNESTILAAERGHWYDRQGNPHHTVIGKNGNERPTTIRDARENDWLPSVTLILKVAAQPGLEAWKAQQLLQAALTLPKLPDESVDDYAKRVIEDSKAQSLKARERGTELHATIEEMIQGKLVDRVWDLHAKKLVGALDQHGIDLFSGNAERSFASELGYAGKIDYSHDSGLLIDFKTTARITTKTKPYDEHLMQCAAYGFGLFKPKFRALNVFVGIEDKEVRIFEHEWTDIERGFNCFTHLLRFWYAKNRL